MIEAERGFSIDAALYPWGTLPGDIAGIGRLPSTGGYLHRDLPCNSVLGIAATGVAVSSPASDRPVLTVTYELAEPHGLDALRAQLGAPMSEERRDLSGYRDPSAGVARWARWRRPTIDINLSIYGGVRSVKFGRSVGLVSLNWSDVIAAASPFVPAWRAASSVLDDAARSVEAFRRFDLPEPLRPAAEATEADSADLLAARRALFNRALLATPRPIRDRLDPRAFALWRSASDGQWALSNAWDTVPLRDVRVDWSEIQPAKGGGRSALSLGGWSVVMPFGTAAIAAAAAALASLPHIVVEKHEGYDA